MDEAMYRAVYHSDPDDETLATFYGMLQRIPDAIKSIWHPSMNFDQRTDSMLREAGAMDRLEKLTS